MDIPTSTATLVSVTQMDWPLLAIAAAVISLESFSSGSTRSSTVAIVMPITSLIFQWLPGTIFISQVMTQLAASPALAAFFGLIFIGLYFLINRMLFAFGSGGGNVLEALISGLSTTIILIVFWIMTPCLDSLWHFGPQVMMVFGDRFRALWLVTAYGALAYTRG